ncbi:MAG: HAMP domain-containing protein [Acidobacteria bacterium]|nr:HAMP domain-containing protein [Acidobacteriota bacterium]
MTALSLGSAWTRRGIQTRVMLLVGAGVLASLAILGGAAWYALTAVADRLASGRGLLARSVATHLDVVLEDELSILQGIPASPRFDLADEDPQPEGAAVRDAYLRSRLARRVMLVARDLRVLVAEPSPSGPAPPAALVAEAFERGRPTVSPLAVEAGDRRLYLVLPLRDWRGAVAVLAVAVVDPAGARFWGILSPFELGPTGTAEILDGEGVVIAQSGRRPTFERAADWPRVAEAARERGAAATFVDDDRSMVVAAAPLRAAPWVVTVRQDQAETFAEARRLRRAMLWLGPTLLALALVFAWGAARSVRRPLGLLTLAAERIASGDLEQPIPRLPEDEVGRLGRSLEGMRVALKGSLDEIASANLALEGRVEARTRELQGLYRELQERERWREELLRKVISAQEDERKRLARELHDETSQTLSALAMKIETALAASPPGAPRERLVEARALTVRTLDELHRLIFDLRPSVLDDLGLLSAIRWYAERHLEPLGIIVQFEASGFERRLRPELETALFRVAQEAITNIAKHAGAETVLIQCLERDGRVTIEIEDDGKGFAPESLPPPAARERGLGLMGMRERVELFGGTIELDSAPGQGTRVKVSVKVREVVDGQDSGADRR